MSELLIDQTDIRVLGQISPLIFLSFFILALGKVIFALEIRVANKTHFKPKKIKLQFKKTSSIQLPSSLFQPLYSV